MPCVSNSKNTRLLVKLCTRGELEESGLYGTPETEKEERENAKKKLFVIPRVNRTDTSAES